MSPPNSAAWLVKSSGRILGPFSQDTIEKMLLVRDLVVLDEVALPSKRWTYIRDTPAFSKIVEDIRIRNLQSTDDTTSTIGAGTASITASVTEPISEYIDDLTDDITGFEGAGQEIVYDNVRETPSSAQNRRPTVSAYGYEGDRVVRQKANETSRLLWVVTGIILLTVVAFVVFKQYVTVPMGQRKASIDNYKLGMDAMAIGDYLGAMAHLKRANQLNPEKIDVNLILASLALQIEGNTLMARRLLEDYLKSANPVDEARAATALGLAALIDSDLATAKQQFERALAKNAAFTPPLVNLGAVALLRQDYAGAIGHFKNAIAKGERDGAAYLMFAEAQLLQWRETKVIEDLASARKILRDFLSYNVDYAQEAKLLQQYIAFLEGRPLTEKVASELLDMDPRHTELHRHNLFIYRQRVSWSHLGRFCEQMQDEQSSSARVRAWYGYCLFRSGRKDQARPVVEDAGNRDPRDPLVQAILGYYYRETGDEQRYLTHLSKAQEFNRKEQLLLPQLLQARFNHDQGNHEEAIEIWREMLVRDPKPVAAYAGIAQYYYLKQNFSEAMRFLKDGLKASNSYKPLLELHMSAKKAGLIPEDGAP